LSEILRARFASTSLTTPNSTALELDIELGGEGISVSLLSPCSILARWRLARFSCRLERFSGLRCFTRSGFTFSYSAKISCARVALVMRRIGFALLLLLLAAVDAEGMLLAAVDAEGMALWADGLGSTFLRFAFFAVFASSTFSSSFLLFF